MTFMTLVYVFAVFGVLVFLLGFGALLGDAFNDLVEKRSSFKEIPFGKLHSEDGRLGSITPEEVLRYEGGELMPPFYRDKMLRGICLRMDTMSIRISSLEEKIKRV